MKTQIKFQKILSLVTLIIAAIAFVYVICFFSGNLSAMMDYRTLNYSVGYLDIVEVNGVEYTFGRNNQVISLTPTIRGFTTRRPLWIRSSCSA